MANAPPAYEQLDEWLDARRSPHDLYVIGTQENSDDSWHELIANALGSLYVRIGERAMGQIKLSVFVHRRHAHAVSAVETSYTPTGAAAR